ncbi:hypothetical protein ABW20_dc0110708 [Dactylellina cionopaga]|nr:hypothetical protein ABW20_dc0110708 [Dactylellina cionopaga]
MDFTYSNPDTENIDALARSGTAARQLRASLVHFLRARAGHSQVGKVKRAEGNKRVEDGEEEGGHDENENDYSEDDEDDEESNRDCEGEEPFYERYKGDNGGNDYEDDGSDDDEFDNNDDDDDDENEEAEIEPEGEGSLLAKKNIWPYMGTRAQNI